MNTPPYPHRKDADHPYNIMQVPRISTQHITASDGSQLRKCLTQEVLAQENYGNDPSWHMLHIAEFDPAEWLSYSTAFALAVQFFAERGYYYLIFDADGDVISELPTFDW